jgi:5-methylcytosine-specific restriction endonuclease McrA
VRETDQDTGKIFHLDSTPELSAELGRLNEACKHPKTEIRQRKNKAGAILYREQCLRCGNPFGMFLKHSRELEGVPAWDEHIALHFDSARKSERATIIQRHVRIQREKSVGLQAQYKSYLRSNEWLSKRDKVLQRANGRCEGCGEKLASQVHHLAYDHIFDEFLFELVAVCDGCHERLHADDDNPDHEVSAEDCEGCRSCRWQDDYSGRMWCVKFDTLAAAALSVSGDCGPQRNGFEPLR